MNMVDFFIKSPVCQFGLGTSVKTSDQWKVCQTQHIHLLGLFWRCKKKQIFPSIVLNSRFLTGFLEFYTVPGKRLSGEHIDVLGVFWNLSKKSLFTNNVCLWVFPKNTQYMYIVVLNKCFFFRSITEKSLSKTRLR